MIIVEVWEKFKKIGWFLPGFILYAAYPPMCETADVLFALAPLMWLSRQGNAKESAKRWFQAGAFYWLATLSWMPAIIKNGGPWPLVILGWGALSAYCAAYFALYGWLSAKYWAWAKSWPRRILGILFAEPVLWCGLELLRSRLMGGFAWNHLGVVPANVGFGAPAALGGVYLLSAVVILINGTFAGVAERMVAGVRARRRMAYDASALSRWRSLETLLAVVVVAAIYKCASFVALPDVSGRESGVKVALVQRDFPCVFKSGAEENPFEVYSRLLDGVAALKPDLVVLAESALCEFGPVDQQGAMRFASFVKEKTGADLLAGGTRFEEGMTFNSAGLYSAGDVKAYDKVHLVPFGEYIPGDKWITALQKLAPVGSCTPGELKTLEWNGHRLGVAICYEDTDSAQVRELSRNAGALVFITNDSWFSNSNEALAHAWQATARAIETGLPVVRVGNNGVTGTILPTGRTTWLLGADGRPLVDGRGAMLDRVAFRPACDESGGWRGHLTPYAAIGDWPLGATFALLIAAMILVKYHNTYGKHRAMSL